MRLGHQNPTKKVDPNLLGHLLSQNCVSNFLDPLPFTGNLIADGVCQNLTVKIQNLEIEIEPSFKNQKSKVNPI